jgi:hypothetical protein
MTVIELPVRGIAKIHQNSIPDNFTFINKTVPLYRCNTVLAQLLSPTVANFVASHSTVDSFCIEIENLDDFTVFRSFLTTGIATISIFEKSCLFGGICKRVWGHTIRRGAVR